LAIAWAVATALCAISFAADVVSWFFSLYIPLYLFNLSFRTITLALVLVYGKIHHNEIRAFIKNAVHAMTEKQKFFKELDETEGFAKLKLLQEHSAKKKRLRQEREEKERSL
jgi:hypothetical protein